MEISDQAFSSSSRQQQRGGYEVFLSFRGKDTRDFADHLYSAISRAGVFTFRDDDRLERGNDISIELVKAIQESRISLIVFSRNYAGSSWCLGELVKIMECKNTVQQVVLPIFYDVDPSEVSKQEGSFGEAFAELKERFVAEMNMVSRWRAALTEAANISGWLLTSSQHRWMLMTQAIATVDQGQKYGHHGLIIILGVGFLVARSISPMVVVILDGLIHQCVLVGDKSFQGCCE